MLIGSQALKKQVIQFPISSNADWDFIGQQTCEVPKEHRSEIHDTAFLNNKDAVDLFDENGVCSLQGLALIKRSHLWRDYKFDKHITTYHKWLLPRVKPFSDLEKAFLKQRTVLSLREFSRGNPNLKQTNEDFFDDPVEKKYDHDYLHQLFAYHSGTPLYESLKHQDKKHLAWCEEDLWDTLSYEDKCRCVAEETYVIATERFLVPTEWQEPYRLCYMRALRKVCTTLTSGWFRDFAIDNYPQIVAMFCHEKFQNVKHQLGE